MKRLLLIFILLSSLSLFAQFNFKYKPINPTPVTDISAITATTIYWVLADNVQPDKVIHFLVGYFATNAMNQLLSATEIPRILKIAAPITFWVGLSLMKEAFFDGSPDWNAFKAGMLECGISVISFQLTYTIQYKSRSASALIINN